MSRSNLKIEKLNFIGIGVMKSATTWLSQCLREHPDVFVSEVKEIHFFSNKYELGLDWYLQQFNKSDGYTAVGEFSVSYFDEYRYIDRIKSDLGDVKILINLRDPITRFISHLKHLYRVEYLSREDVKYDIDIDFFHRITQRFPTLLKKGVYYPMISYCQQTFGVDNVLITTKEDIDEDPKKVINGVFNFLNVDDKFEPTVIQKNVSVGIIPKSNFLEKLRVKMYRFSKKFLPRIILMFRKYRVGEAYRKLNNKDTQIYLNQDVYEYLCQYYSEDLELVKNKLKINTSNWLTHEQRN